MNPYLDDLYHLPQSILPQDVYLIDLREQCAHTEERLRKIAEKLPDSYHKVIEAYIDIRDKLELQSVKAALGFGKKQGENIHSQLTSFKFNP